MSVCIASFFAGRIIMMLHDKPHEMHFSCSGNSLLQQHRPNAEVDVVYTVMLPGHFQVLFSPLISADTSVEMLVIRLSNAHGFGSVLVLVILNTEYMSRRSNTNIVHPVLGHR